MPPLRRRALLLRLVWAFALAGAAGATGVACGSSSNASSADAGTVPGDGGAPIDASTSDSAPVDAGAADAVAVPDAHREAAADAFAYPAFTVDVAKIVGQGGATLASPSLVTVSWSMDGDAGTWEAFDDAVGSSAYWKTITKEYGVGPASSGGHVRIATAPPTTMTNLDVDALVSSNAGGAWPPATANTVYVVYLPPSTTLYLNGEPDAGGVDVCNGGTGAFHTETQSSARNVYAVVAQCPGAQVTDVTYAATIELAEAVTNPHPFTNPGYVGFDLDHVAFELLTGFQDEIADGCKTSAPPYATSETGFTYTVARSWSNASAASGHDWCVPSVGTYYNATILQPAAEQTVGVDLTPLGTGSGTVSTRGFTTALGQAVTIPLGLYSDGPTGPWNLDVDVTWPVVNGAGAVVPNGEAVVSLDASSGSNGDIVHLTVTPTAWGPLGVMFVSVRSLLPGETQHHALPIVIGPP
jgi:hypothetical protein